MDPYSRTSCSFGGLFTLAGIIFLGTVVWKGNLSFPMLGFLAIWLAIGIGLLLWGLRQVRSMTRERRNAELMGLIYAVVGIPAMLATAGALMLTYIALATSATMTSPTGSMSPLEIAGFFAVMFIGLIVGGFGVGAFLSAVVGKRLLGLTRADFEAFPSWNSFPALDSFYQRMLDILFGKTASTTPVPKKDQPHRKIGLISLRNIFAGVVTGLLILTAVGWLIMISFDLLPAGLQAWILSYSRLIIGLTMISFVITVLWYQHRHQTRYRPGDNPLPQARIMLAFGRRSMAIRYLEDALRQNPSSAEISQALQELRHERKRM